MQITLTDLEQAQAMKYATDTFDARPYYRRFGNKGPLFRKKVINRIATGKMAEIAFAKVAGKDTKTEVPVNLSSYANTIDAKIKGHKIEIFATTSIKSNLLINLEKMELAKKKDRLAELFVLMHVSSNRYGMPTGTVTFEGFEKLKNFSNVEVVMEGETIPGTSTKALMDNYAIQKENLEHDWNHMVYIINNEMPDVESIQSWKSPRS